MPGSPRNAGPFALVDPFIVSGASDDLVEVSGRVDDEVQHYGPGPAVGRIETPEGDGLLVVVQYVNPGTWSVGVAPLEEGFPIPPWKIEIGNAPDCSYSAALTVWAPESATLQWATS